MNTLFGRMVVGMIPGLVASGIAIVIVWNFVSDHRAENGKACGEKPCFIILDKRLSVVESDLKTRIELKTANRYTSIDAERDRRATVAHIERNDERLRRELRVLSEKCR